MGTCFWIVLLTLLAVIYNTCYIYMYTVYKLYISCIYITVIYILQFHPRMGFCNSEKKKEGGSFIRVSEFLIWGTVWMVLGGFGGVRQFSFVEG